MQKCKILPCESDHEYIFMNVNGLYVDITNQIHVSLADYLALQDIVLDDDAQFCRIVRTYLKTTLTYEIRCHGGKVRINVHVRHIY